MKNGIGERLLFAIPGFLFGGLFALTIVFLLQFVPAINTFTLRYDWQVTLCTAGVGIIVGIIWAERELTKMRRGDEGK